MTRKDYKLLAATLNRIVKVAKMEELSIVALTIKDIADCLHNHNPNFKYDVFYEACGL